MDKMGPKVTNMKSEKRDDGFLEEGTQTKNNSLLSRPAMESHHLITHIHTPIPNC